MQKRTSTVQRLTRPALDRLITYCELNNCGAIVRIWGQELALELEELYDLLVFCELSSVYIRKGWNG
jgi:hypothetical protein